MAGKWGEGKLVAEGGVGTVGEEKSKDVRCKKLPYMGITKLLGAHLMMATKEAYGKGSMWRY